MCIRQISVCGSAKFVNHLNHEYGCFARYWGARFWIYFQRRKMNKLNKKYDDFFKQLIPESPLKQAFRNWKETTKKIKERQNEK